MQVIKITILRICLLILLIQEKSFLVYASVVADHNGVTIIVNNITNACIYLYATLYSTTAPLPSVCVIIRLLVWYSIIVITCIMKNFMPKDSISFILDILKYLNDGDIYLYFPQNSIMLDTSITTGGISEIVPPRTSNEFT